MTAVDFVPQAIEFARARANERGIDVTFICGDVLEFGADSTYDLIIDSGCLHSLAGASRQRYRDRLDAWLAPAADFVLVHFLQRHRLDWSPYGPRARSREAIEREFARLVLREHHATPRPDGRGRDLGEYWFRNPS